MVTRTHRVRTFALTLLTVVSETLSAVLVNLASPRLNVPLILVVPGLVIVTLVTAVVVTLMPSTTGDGAAGSAAGSGPVAVVFAWVRRSVLGEGVTWSWRRAAATVTTGVVVGLVTPFLVSWAVTWRPDAGGTCDGISPGRGLTYVTVEQGQCVGYTDSVGAPPDRVSPSSSDPVDGVFGRETGLVSLQQQLLTGNPAVDSEMLTVVWFGSLSCSTYINSSTCADGTNFESQRQQLTGLLAARRTDKALPFHVVIANGGAQMGQAEQVADRLVALRQKVRRLVVIGGDESVQGTKAALGTLLKAEIPVIAPTLHADKDAPDKPFIHTPDGTGYLQLLPPNRRWAARMVDFIADHTTSGATRTVHVVHDERPHDDYTDSLAEGVHDEAERRLGPQPDVVRSADDLPDTVCAPTENGKAGAPDSPERRAAAGRAPAVVFADRSKAFQDFVKQLDSRCPAGPALLVGSNALNRYLGEDEQRRRLKVPWPMAYFKVGAQCTELDEAARVDQIGPEFHLLKALRARPRDQGPLGCVAGQETSSTPGTPATGRHRPMDPPIGVNVSLFWDAVQLAQASVESRHEDGSMPVRDAEVSGVNGRYIVRDGRLTPLEAPRYPMCLYTAKLPLPGEVVKGVDGNPVPTGRATDYCTKLYPAGPTSSSAG